MIILQFLWGFLIGTLGSVAAMGIILIISGFFVDTNRLYDKDSKFYRFLLYYYTVLTFIVARIKIEIEGMELVPKDRNFVLMTNHRSNFDPIISWIVLRHITNLTYISKPENFHVPFFGRVVRRCCFIPIDRNNPRKSKKTMDYAAELMKKNKNCSIGIYPEGTRSKTGQLLPFHNMVFRVAQEANAPIVVAVLENTQRIHKNFPFKSSKIKLRFVDIISEETVASEKTSVLSERVRSDMLNALGQTDNQKGDGSKA